MAKCAVAGHDQRTIFVRATEINEEIMKTKWMVLVVTLLFALGMMAQTATQAAPAAPAAGDKASACACCSDDMANMKPGDKCPMMKDGKMAKGESCCGKMAAAAKTASATWQPTKTARRAAAATSAR